MYNHVVMSTMLYINSMPESKLDEHKVKLTDVNEYYSHDKLMARLEKEKELSRNELLLLDVLRTKVKAGQIGDKDTAALCMSVLSKIIERA